MDGIAIAFLLYALAGGKSSSAKKPDNNTTGANGNVIPAAIGAATPLVNAVAKNFGGSGNSLPNAPTVYNYPAGTDPVPSQDLTNYGGDAAPDNAPVEYNYPDGTDPVPSQDLTDYGGGDGGLYLGNDGVSDVYN